MAKGRRNKEADGGSFDSLLDTMTNVVGILVILLVVTQLGVRDAIRRIRWNIADISPRKLEQLRREGRARREGIAALEKELDERKRRENARSASMAQAREELAKLRSELKDEKAPDTDPDAVRARLETLEAEIARQRAALAEAQEHLAELKAKLADTPERQAPAPKIVRLPNPRPAPPGAGCVWVLCRYGRVAVADTAALRRFAKEKTEAARRLLEYREEGKLSGAGLQKWKGNRGKDASVKQPETVYDGQKVQDYFDRNAIGSTDFRLHMTIEKGLGRENLWIEFKSRGGEPVMTPRSAAPRYRRALRGIDPAKQYVRFLVWPDSFEAYIAAREILEDDRIPAGWTLYTSDRWRFAWDFGIKLQGEKAPTPPPPPPPDAKPKPAPPPPNVLD